MTVTEIMKRLAQVAKLNNKGRRYDADGKFYPDPTPIAPPVGYVASPSIADQIRTMIRSEHLRQAAEAAGADTFEQADDFNVGDDYDPRSPWEETFDGEFLTPVAALHPEPVPAPPPGATAAPAASPAPAEAPPGAVPNPPKAG